ncbi:hypothetical protein DUNSADRAFT_13420 [Dunaliella salina]|uniref:Uncharacterized protein n=1 Tax=Dunaliella salina TaxID=3046 RepID=A0ABQ7H3A4_DUNSA|nr:hypothetical protein DUNSADRAFT_13420 [Dunaliella salina]|eukprot:KAF5841344.1 hypothetical protein DUNSADRAFT_13420 [Dunaliella salina]
MFLCRDAPGIHNDLGALFHWLELTLRKGSPSGPELARLLAHLLHESKKGKRPTLAVLSGVVTKWSSKRLSPPIACADMPPHPKVADSPSVRKLSTMRKFLSSGRQSPIVVPETPRFLPSRRRSVGDPGTPKFPSSEWQSPFVIPGTPKFLPSEQRQVDDPKAHANGKSANTGMRQQDAGAPSASPDNNMQQQAAGGPAHCNGRSASNEKQQQDAGAPSASLDNNTQQQEAGVPAHYNGRSASNEKQQQEAGAPFASPDNNMQQQAAGDPARCNDRSSGNEKQQQGAGDPSASLGNNTHQQGARALAASTSAFRSSALSLGSVQLQEDLPLTPLGLSRPGQHPGGQRRSFGRHKVSFARDLETDNRLSDSDNKRAGVGDEGDPAGHSPEMRRHGRDENHARRSGDDGDDVQGVWMRVQSVLDARQVEQATKALQGEGTPAESLQEKAQRERLVLRTLLRGGIARSRKRTWGQGASSALPKPLSPDSTASKRSFSASFQHDVFPVSSTHIRAPLATLPPPSPSAKLLCGSAGEGDGESDSRSTQRSCSPVGQAGSHVAGGCLSSSRSSSLGVADQHQRRQQLQQQPGQLPSTSPAADGIWGVCAKTEEALAMLSQVHVAIQSLQALVRSIQTLMQCSQQPQPSGRSADCTSSAACTSMTQAPPLLFLAAPRQSSPRDGATVPCSPATSQRDSPPLLTPACTPHQNSPLYTATALPSSASPPQGFLPPIRPPAAARQRLPADNDEPEPPPLPLPTQARSHQAQTNAPHASPSLCAPVSPHFSQHPQIQSLEPFLKPSVTPPGADVPPLQPGATVPPPPPGADASTPPSFGAWRPYAPIIPIPWEGLPQLDTQARARELVRLCMSHVWTQQQQQQQQQPPSSQGPFSNQQGSSQLQPSQPDGSPNTTKWAIPTQHRPSPRQTDPQSIDNAAIPAHHRAKGWSKRVSWSQGLAGLEDSAYHCCEEGPSANSTQIRPPRSCELPPSSGDSCELSLLTRDTHKHDAGPPGSPEPGSGWPSLPGTPGGAQALPLHCATSARPAAVPHPGLLPGNRTASSFKNEEVHLQMQPEQPPRRRPLSAPAFPKPLSVALNVDDQGCDSSGQ